MTNDHDTSPTIETPPPDSARPLPPQRTDPAPVAPPATEQHPRPAAPAAPPLARPVDRSWIWPALNLLAIAGVAAMHWLATWLPLNDVSRSTLRTENPVPYRPGSWFDMVWWVVLALVACYVIATLIPSVRRRVPQGFLGPFLFAASIAHIVWIALEHWRHHQPAMIAIAVAWVCLLVLTVFLRSGQAAARSTRPTFWTRLLSVPISLYHSTATVALAIAIQVWMSHGGWRGPFGLNGWTVIFMLLSLMVAAAFAFFGRDPAWPAIQVLAFLGIAQATWSDVTWLSWIAIVMVVLAAGVAAMGFILAMETTTAAPTPQPTPPSGPRRSGRLSFFRKDKPTPQ